MSLDYKLYRSDIVKFLRTLTIKFESFATMAIKKHILHYGHEPEEDKNPYYLNLCGEYNTFDTPMYVNSADTGEEILFSKENKKLHPKTFALYNISSTEYALLCEKYPSQQGLITSIIYSNVSMDDVLNAPIISILDGDFNLLHTNERESIKTALNKTAEYVLDRWYIADYDYEEAYPITFMGSMISLLFQTIIRQRILNLKTAEVHPLHIWEYLDSKGLGDYKSILNDRQALFLYRNIDYILTNKGKKSNLEILVINLLKEIGIDMVGKTILQDSGTYKDYVITKPEFVSEDILPLGSEEQQDESAAETMDIILNRVYGEGYYPNYGYIDSAEMEYKFSRTNFNMLPTRLLEIKKIPFDTRYKNTFAVFLFDTMIYQMVIGNTQFNVEFTDSNTNIRVKLSVQDAIALFHYVHHRHLNNVPITIPNLYTTHLCFKNDFTGINLETFNYWNHTHLIKNIVNIERMMERVIPIDGNFTDIDEFITEVCSQFMGYMVDVNFVREACDRRYQFCMVDIYKRLTHRYTFDLVLSEHKFYTDWISSNEVLNTLLTSYEGLANSKEMYESLCDSLLSALFPISNDMIKLYMGSDVDGSVLYTKLKELFIQLCSYRLTFLESERESFEYYTPPSTAIDIEKTVENQNTYINIDFFNKVNVHLQEITELTVKDLGGDLSISDSIEHDKCYSFIGIDAINPYTLENTLLREQPFPDVQDIINVVEHDNLYVPSNDNDMILID